MRSSRKLVAGLLDAGCAALGTFLAGIIAVRSLDTTTLALYAVLFSATVFAMLLPRQLHYIPSQIAANLEPDLRSPDIRGDARRAGLVSAGTFVIVVISGLLLVGTTNWVTCLVMGLTAAAYAVVSPMQDHVRASLHLVDRHFSAALTSVTLACVTGAACILSVTHAQAAGTDLLPFGSLFLGNVASLVVGLLLLRAAQLHQRYTPAALVVRARFLFAELAVQGAWFACNYVVLFVLGAAALGHLETARVTASPINILSTAVLTFMGPAMLRKLHATKDNPHGPRGEIVRTVIVLVVGGGIYIAILAAFSPVFSTILDKHIDVGLSTARIVGFTIEGTSSIAAFIVFAMGQTKSALGMAITAGGMGLGLTALGTLVIGPYALPVGQGIGMGTRLVRSLVLVGRHVGDASPDGQPPDASSQHEPVERA